MNTGFLRRCATCAALVLVAALAGAQAPPAAGEAAPEASLPAEYFFRAPDLAAAALSPSGRHLAVLAAMGGGRMGLAVIELRGARSTRPVAHYADADIASFHWVGEDWLVYNLTDRQRGSGDQTFAPGLYSVRSDGSERRQLVESVPMPVISGPASRGRQLPYNHRLLHVPADDSREVIVGELLRDGAGDPLALIPKRLDVSNGRVRSLAYGVPGDARAWWFGPDGEPRAVFTRRLSKAAIHWRAPGQATWRMLWEGQHHAMPFAPHSVDAQGTLYVTELQAGGEQVLKRFDLERGRPEPHALVSVPGFDFTGTIVSETVGSRALGVRVVSDAEGTSWFDERLKALQAEADRVLPGRINRLSCRRCDAPDMTVLVLSYADRDPGQYWIHTAADGKWLKVGDTRRGSDPRRLARVDFERIATRDGQPMPVWITRPAGTRGPLPTVVLVHGGPWLRGRQWGWDAQSQFLASRGYLVIEPEFRGSRGYGHAWHRAGWREWGRSMQDDVADALKWAVQQGHADGRRACIVGGSYGGYAVLMGLIRDQELYRCGAAWVAVTDPRLLFRWSHGSDSTEESRAFDLPRLIGDPVADAARIDEVTPVLHAARIRAPLLLAMGREDRRVPITHGDRMRSALAEAGRPLDWVVYDDEGHTWNQLSTRLDFAARLEAFLARHLAP